MIHSLLLQLACPRTRKLGASWPRSHLHDHSKSRGEKAKKAAQNGYPSSPLRTLISRVRNDIAPLWFRATTWQLRGQCARYVLYCMYARTYRKQGT
jgi:hypothetical protein